VGVGRVDAVNCTDNSAAHAHVSAVAAGRIVLEEGLEPIVQFTCRDRNRLALQADMLGAAALGVRNLMLMRGDDVTAGDQPDARPVFDLDTIQLLHLARTLRDDGAYLSGRRLDHAPAFFIGAVEDPFGQPVEARPGRLAQKVEAGAQFVQTQVVFDPERLRPFLGAIGELGLLERVFVLPSVFVLRSLKTAHYLREHVPGLSVPDAVLARLDRGSAEAQADAGMGLALEIVEQLRHMEGVAGVHLISIRWEAGITQVVERAGLLPRKEAGGSA
jgi:methylenetetrahydrofolate reductase (NADPH)